MKLLIILNRTPYDGTDVMWNALRLAAQAQRTGMTVRIFLMNDAVDLAREGLPVQGEDDLRKMLLDVIAAGAEAKLCKTCVTRCGIGSGALRSEVAVGTMSELVDWIADSDRMLTF